MPRSINSPLNTPTVYSTVYSLGSFVHHDLGLKRTIKDLTETIHFTRLRCSKQLTNDVIFIWFSKHSTCSNLLETVNDWSLALDNHMQTDAIYTDFRKAFDSVSHSKLIAKLESYNINGDLLG